MLHWTCLVVWCATLLAARADSELDDSFYQDHLKMIADSQSENRDRRDVIEEEKFFALPSENEKTEVRPTPWMPHALIHDETTTQVYQHHKNEQHKRVQPFYDITEKPITEKTIGRGARASNENWIKLPYPAHDQPKNDILTPPQPSGDLINSRMPRVKFVTQNKQLETSESRNDKESIQIRPTRKDDSIRTDFVRPGDDDRHIHKPTYPRQAIYYPEESRRFTDNERYYPSDDFYSRDPYYDNIVYDRRRLPQYGSRIDRYDDINDYIPRKPKRIIYYAHLPEVVRTPPSVDLRNRYTAPPFSRYDEDYAIRSGRYDYRFRTRYPYAPLRQEERNYRDLEGAGSQVNDKNVEEKITTTPIMPKKEPNNNNNNINIKDNSLIKNPALINRLHHAKIINSHQYHDAPELLYDRLNYKGFDDFVRRDDGFARYEERLFQPDTDDPYHRNIST